MICMLTEHDIPKWRILISEVEPLFGPMLDDPNFIPSIKDAIDKDMIYGYKNNETKQLIGVIILNREMNSIEWLAVLSQSKKEGIGSKLLQKAIEELDSTRDIIVQTFSAEIESGLHARRLYQKYGFIDFKEAGKNPAGINTVLMIKKAAINGHLIEAK